MGRRAGTPAAPSVRGMTNRTHRAAILTGSVLTLVAVPTGLTVTLGNLQTVMTLSLATGLALLVLLVGRWPRAVLILSVLWVGALHCSALIGSGWVWPATAALVATVLAGRAGTAITVAASRSRTASSGTCTWTCGRAPWRSA